MRIVVCLKVVPATTHDLRLDPATHRLQRSGSGVISPSDRHAVEEALRISERRAGVEVVVLSVAPSSELPAMREALGMGAARAVLVADPAFAGSDLLPTSRALARALEAEAPDLTLFGAQGPDSGGAMLGAAVAERRGLPLLSQAEELEVGDERVVVKRQTETGYEVLAAPLPCVVAVAGSINQPRFASVKGKVAARSKPVALRSCAALDLGEELVGAAGSGTVVRAVSEPPARAQATVLKDRDDVVEQVYRFLAERRLVP